MRSVSRSRLRALPAFVVGVAFAASSIGLAAPASASTAADGDLNGAQAAAEFVLDQTAADDTAAVEAAPQKPASEAPAPEAAAPADEAAVAEPATEPQSDASAPATEPSDAPASPSAPASDAVTTADAQVLATAINMQGYSGGSVTAVNPGQSFEVGNTVRNVGPVGIPANAARLHFRADNGLIITTQNVRNVANYGTVSRSCALTAKGTALDCVSQSNWNAIGGSSTANNYSNFYTSVRIPADAIPGTTYALRYSFDFDAAKYQNTNPSTSTTWYYRVRVPAPVIQSSAVPVGPHAAVVGTGVPGATVYLSQQGGAPLGTAVVGSDGRWSVVPSIPFVDGVNRLSAYQHSVDADSTSTTGSVLVDAIVDAPTVVAPGGEQDLTQPVELSGEGEPGATIEVRDDAGTVVCSTTVEADGTWACTIPQLDDRDQQLSVGQIDKVGNVSTTVPVIVIATPAPGLQPGDGTDPEGPQPVEGSDPVTAPQPESGVVLEPASRSVVEAPSAPTQGAALAATGGEVDGILLGVGGLLLLTGILSLAIPRRRVK